MLCEHFQHLFSPRWLLKLEMLKASLGMIVEISKYTLSEIESPESRKRLLETRKFLAQLSNCQLHKEDLAVCN
jgi:hypothetical protein